MENGGKGESAHEERKPHRGNPGYGNEEQDILISERKGPPDGGPKGNIVDDIPDSKGPKENGGAYPGIRGREESNGEEDEDGSGLAKDFEGEKALGELAYRSGLNVKVS
jgi:hypothetical protein